MAIQKKLLPNNLKYALSVFLVGVIACPVIYFSPSEVTYRAKIAIVKALAKKDFDDITRTSNQNRICEVVESVSDRKECYDAALRNETTSIGVYIFTRGYLASNTQHSQEDKRACATSQHRAWNYLDSSSVAVEAAISKASNAYANTLFSRWLMPNSPAKMKSSYSKDRQVKKSVIEDMCDLTTLGNV
jgi:hypothetical protein